MNLLRTTFAAIATTALAASGLQAQTTSTTDPVGFVTVNITPGTGVAKRNTLLSIPLLESESITGAPAGFITAVTSNTLVNTNAGWTPGQLSDPALPYVIQIASGAAAGRMFLIASSNAVAGSIAGAPNTATNVTVSSLDAAQVPDLTTLGIVAGTDTYKIFACDTIGSFFGVPPTGVLGGTNAATADTLVITLNGTASTYFFNTGVATNRWSRVAAGSPDSRNVALLPNYGIQYGRLSTNSLSFVPIGQVPTTNRQVSIKNSGTTFLAQFWPADTTIATLGLQTVPGWLSGSNAASADNIILTSAGSASTYFYNGTNWRRVAAGNPISDTTIVPLGSTIQINKKGTNAGFSTLTQTLPYNLNL
jgi:hypothetical protein